MQGSSTVRFEFQKISWVGPCRGWMAVGETRGIEEVTDLSGEGHLQGSIPEVFLFQL